MPRGPFDTTVDIYRGPTYGSTFVGTCACRLVPEFYDPPTSEPFLDRTAYVTLDAILPEPPQGAVAWPIITLDMETASQFAIPSGGAINWRVIWVEIINFSTFPQYYRAHVAPI